MDHHPHSQVESILAGTAEVEDGWIRSSISGNSGKESLIPVVEVLDQPLTSSLCRPDLRRECLAALPGVCAAYGMLPSRYFPTGHLVVDHQSSICVGGTDVRRGTLDQLVVTVKSVTHSSTGSRALLKSAYQEVITWKNLDHRNILLLLGVDVSISPLSTISEWMEHGSLREYLGCFPNAPRSKLLFDASQGLEYMHRLGCIHGDLKASNILVNNDLSAVLANFHLASFLPESGVDAGVPASECDPLSVRWLAPELLFPKEFGLRSARRTKETDTYAFAMVMFEVFSGSFPFQGLRNETVILLVRSGDHPRRPESGSDLGLTDELWDTMKLCWKRRSRRCGVSRVASTLSQAPPCGDRNGNTREAFSIRSWLRPRMGQARIDILGKSNGDLDI